MDDEVLSGVKKLGEGLDSFCVSRGGSRPGAQALVDHMILFTTPDTELSEGAYLKSMKFIEILSKCSTLCRIRVLLRQAFGY
jgi:hypothetical protein